MLIFLYLCAYMLMTKLPGEQVIKFQLQGSADAMFQFIRTPWGSVSELLISTRARTRDETTIKIFYTKKRKKDLERRRFVMNIAFIVKNICKLCRRKEEENDAEEGWREQSITLFFSSKNHLRLKNIRGTLVVTPEFDPSVVRFVGGLLKSIVPGLDIASVGKDLEMYS